MPEMLFHFKPHIYTLGELLDKEGSQTKDRSSSVVQCSSHFHY